MKKYLLLLIYLLVTLSSFAQDRLYTDKEHGGAENGVFGKINDEINISPIGQLSYEIPIPALPGTGGMKPNLSVCYNSSTKNGLAGYGFDLTGLSIISRIPSDRFHDGMATAIDFTNHDHFALDGQRLIKYSYSYGTETEYRTENNSFAKILAKGKSSNPTSFTVYTKSGLIYDYVTVSKALGKTETDSTLFWFVSKVSDTKGNYFTVTYGGDASTNDFYPSRIDYTGNATAELSPYASIRLSYMSNPYSPVTYVNGVRVTRNRLLSSIALFMGNQAVRSFQFSYQIVNRKYQLSKVTETASGGEHKNPTQLTWTNLNDFKVQNYNYSRTNLIHKAALTVGDFNGDGLADFIATPENDRAGWKGWKLFISHGTYFEQVASGTWNWNDDKLEQVVCGDFNGDGYADVVAKRCHSGKWHNCDLYTTSVDNNGRVSLTFSKCFISLATDYTIQTVELNGDGAADLFAWLSNSKECELIRSEQGANGITPLGYTAVRYCSEKWDRVEFGDFNGDGLTDVMNLNDNGNYIMYCDGAGTMTKEDKSPWPEKKHDLELGDFNGDGKTDMLLTGWTKDPNSGGWSNWCINYSKGDGKFAREYYAKPFDARSKQLYIADLNGDGFDDFQAIDKISSGSNMTQPQAYLSDGRGNFYQQVKGGNVYATDKWHFYVGDFNGDGKADFVCTSDWNKSNWDGYQVYLMPSDKHSLLTGIKDGLGNSTNIDYKYLTDESVFTRGRTNAYPLVSIGLSWPVVASVSTPDGIGGTNVTSYRYEDALFHKNGRGLLGFAKCYVKDENTNTLNTTEYSVNIEKYVIAPKHSQTTVNGKMIEESDHTYTLKSNYASSSYNSDIYTYMPMTVHQKNYELNTGELIKDVKIDYEYDTWGNTTKTIVKDGSIETTTTNTFINNTDKWLLGRLTESTVSKSNENSTITRKSSFEYDQNSGLLTTEVFAPGNTELGYRKSYVHDNFGNIVKSTVSSLDGSSERITQTHYDTKGRYIVSSINSLGFLETLKYNEEEGLVTASTDKNGIVTNYTYDKFGNLVTASTPISKALKTTGWSARMSDAPANALYFEWNKTTGEPSSIDFYDCLGRLLRKVTESVNGKKVYTDQTYDKKGLVERTSEPYYVGEQQYWSKNEYDAVGRTIAQTAPDGSRHIFAYSGLKTTATDPLGSISTKISNLNGLLASSIDNAGTGITYKYDADGKCIETKGSRTTIHCSYDIAGNRISLDDPDLGSSKDTYNGFGELVAHQDGHGESRFEYDTGGRVIKEVRPDVTISTTYDKGWKGAVDEVVSVGSIQSSETYTYDNYGRVIKKNTVIDDWGYETTYTYNLANQVETIKYPKGLKVKNGYDACGIQISVSNADNQKLYWKLHDLDARGQIEKEEYGNGLITTTAHDPKKGSISSILTPGIQNWTYSFDAVGNLVTRRDLKRNLSESFSYDGLYRLTTVRKNGQVTQSMTYDNAGNVTSKSDVGTYIYTDGSNKLSSITDCKRPIATWDEISYNSFDKVAKIVSCNKTMLIEYGPDKSRVLVDIQGVRKYYVDNLFEQKVENGKISSTNYIFVFGKAVAILSQDANDIEDVKYIHHDLLGSIQAYSDELGKLYQELSYDAWGLRRKPETWVVFDVVASSNAYNDHGFGGHEHIDLFELVNMDGRMYDPVVGRFISADPFIQSPDFTQSLNRYAYCINNPLSLIDPSGYSWFSKNWKSITASIVGIAVSVVTLGSGTTIGAVIIAGAAGGAAGALTGALLNGTNIGQIAKSTFMGAFGGSASGFLNFASGGGTIWEQLFKHTFSQGWLEGVQGGNMFHGFMMGAVSGAGGYGINKTTSMTKTLKIISASIVSGTIDEIGGGKFANGAVTGAFSFLFNDYMHLRKTRMHYRDKKFVTFPFDEKVGAGNALMTVDTYVYINDYVQTKILDTHVMLTSYSNISDIDIEGAFGVEFKIGGKKSEFSFKKLTGEYVVPSGTNFAGDIHINNVSYRNALPINLNVFGGWNYSTPGGHGVVTGPTIIGFITGAWGRYNNEFRIK